MLEFERAKDMNNAEFFQWDYNKGLTFMDYNNSRHNSV